MRMTPEEYRERFPDRPEPIPLEYAGKWIAWEETGRKIVAAADDLRELDEIVSQEGVADPIFQRVPRGAFIGGGRNAVLIRYV